MMTEIDLQKHDQKAFETLPSRLNSRWKPDIYVEHALSKLIFFLRKTPAGCQKQVNFESTRKWESW